MAKGRPPTPDAIKASTGNPGKRRGKSTAEPDMLADLTPPSWITPVAQEIWREEAPKYRKALLLTVLDVPAFATLCQSLADYRESVEKCQSQGAVWTKEQDGKDGAKVNGQAYMSPWSQLKSMSFKQLYKAMEKFGATPADRARVEIFPQMGLFPADGAAADQAPSAENRAARHFH